MARQARTNSKRKPGSGAGLSFEKLDERALLAADLSIIDEGLQAGHFENLQNQLNAQVFNADAPFIGDALSQEIGNVDNSSQFIGTLGTKLQVVSLEGDVRIDDVKAKISDALGIQQSDIQVVGDDNDSNVRFEVSLSNTQRFEGVDLDLVGADPEIELLLGNEEQVDLDLSWSYDLAFGVREDNAGNSTFYIDDSQTNELTVDYTATIREDFDSGKGRVGVFLAEFAANEQASQFQGTYDLDLSSTADGTQQVSGSLTGSGQANLAIDASFFPSFLPQGSEGLINLGVMADGVVGYETNLQFSDDQIDAAENDITVGFENVRLDLGRLFRDFIDPLIRDVQENLKPIKPAIDFLTEPVPVISDLFEMTGSGPVTALTLAGYGPNHSVTRTVNILDGILNYRGLAGIEQNEEALFSVEVSKEGVDPETARDRDEKIRENLDKLDRGELELELAEKHKDPEKHAKWEKELSWSAQFDGAFDLPFLTNPDKLAGLLLGDTTNEMFTFEMDADIGLNFDVSVPIVPLMGLVQLNAGIGISLSVDLDGGYDALGIQRLSSVADFTSETSLTQSLQDNQEYLLHGFYLDDHNSNAPGSSEGGKQDAPEVVLGVQISGGMSAGVDLKLLEFKFGGDIVFEGNVEFDLNDLPDPNHAPSIWPTPSTPIWSNYDSPEEWNYDGRFRVNEFSTIYDADAGALFNIDGNLQVGLDATLEVSVIGITIINERWELFRTTLVDGGISTPNDARIIRGVDPPKLGSVNNGILGLYMGSQANRRTNAEPHVSDETFSVHSLGESKDGGETLMVVFESTSGEKYARVFDGVRKIVGSGGSGDDKIRILPGVTSTIELSGGAGDDILSTVGTGTALLRGGSGNDTLLGGGANDSLYGEGGNDTLEGGSGNDLLDGGADDDRIFGHAGNDRLLGRDGDDILEGGHGDDELFGGDDDDLLTGGVGSDEIRGEAGSDTIRFGFFLRDALGVDFVSGGEHEDIVEIYGTEQADEFTIEEVRAGSFKVTNGEHAAFQFSLPEARRDRDTEEIRVSGLGGDDTIRAEGSFNVNRLHLKGGDGNDTLIGSATRDLLSGDDGDDHLHGRGGTDELRGGLGDDVLDGGGDADALYGEAGHDHLNGGSGADASYGGAGNDTIEAGFGFVGDLIDGGEGDDTLNGGAGIDTIHGGDGRDRINGGGLDDVLFGNDGNDIITGGTGRDFVDAGPGDDTLHALAPNFQPLSTSAWDAALQRLTEANSLDEESETLNLLVAHLAVDSMPSNASQRTQLRRELESRRDDSANENEVITSVLIDIDPNQSVVIDQLLGNAGDDLLIGTNYNDALHGGAGSDEVRGGTGDDQIQVELGSGNTNIHDNEEVDHVIGGVNSDILEILGSEENDTFVIQQLGGGVVEVVNGDQQAFRFASPNAQGFSELRISGLGGDDTLEAVGQFDIRLRIDGGDGNDLLVGGNAADWLLGGEGDDTIYGGMGDDEIDGGSGDDILIGERGHDTIVGGLGQDNIQGGHDNDELFALDSNVQLFARPTSTDDADDSTSTAIAVSIVEENDNSNGNQTNIDGGFLDWQPEVKPRWDQLAAQDDSQTIRVDELDGGAGDDRLRGSDDADRLRGGAGNDVIVHSLGEDVIMGGEGKLDRYTFLFTDDSEYVDVYLDNSGDVLVSRSLTSRTRKDHVIGKANHLEIEVVGIEAQGGHDRIEVDFGQQAVMQVHADGGDGNDRFDLSKLPHDAVVIGGDGIDFINQQAPAGNTPTNMVLTDTQLTSGHQRQLESIERATLQGNNGNNVLDARNFNGRVRLAGKAGNDVLWAANGSDVIDGGLGDDTLGIQGDTTITLEQRVVIGMGTDYFRNIERAEVNGGSSANVITARSFPGPVTIRGGGGNDVIVGSAYSDTIYGQDGNDVLYGEDGHDTIYGGNHNDTIYGANGSDVLYGQNGVDVLYGEAGNDSIYGGDSNDYLYGGAGSDLLNGGKHNDVLYGGSGGDGLHGESGNDTLRGESGADTLDGGSGTDTVDGGSGHDTGTQYRRKTGWWIFASWEYQDTLKSIDTTKYKDW